ncbi:MAG TPA: hypothetical protein VIM65_24245 [Cyclobacteriaceae bacterium]
MKKTILLLLACLSLFCCKPSVTKDDSFKTKLTGSWLLLSSTATRKDTVIHNDVPGTKMIKIINDTHFSFLQHTLNVAPDSAARANRLFVAGGGPYTLTGNHYIEHLEFCSALEYEGNNFEFDLEIKGDTLIQTGIEKLKDIGAGEENQLLMEKYIRIKN